MDFLDCAGVFATTAQGGEKNDDRALSGGAEAVRGISHSLFNEIIVLYACDVWCSLPSMGGFIGKAKALRDVF